ncbi:hypothetical protein CAC42_3809 [Sphaceloma murrayae]|uniref:YAG7-like dimerisation domain-containing protein n=1 Tax=Sphaceloma murrayae TaxID=2082308 RepID=A0A2K1QI47_9PEZI|nr:hypothetical protein CAC42_3809 [Sphaceloma murrayae]
MSAVTTNPPPQTESKSARKKREKAEQASKVAATETTPSAASDPVEEKAPTVNGDHSNDSAYVKEIQKQIRNINKKLNFMTKVDSVIAENPKSSLDELVAARKINADQKAQALKKPGLQAQLTQLEDQLVQLKKIDGEYQSRLSSEKEALERKHEAELAQVRESAKKEAEAQTATIVKQKLLVFSQFLRAAAAKRIVEEEADTDESKAFEGALLLVYGGDERAVQAAENIVEGSDESVPSVEGQALSVKYSQIKELSLQHAPYMAEETLADNLVDTNSTAAPTEVHTTIDPSSDPTIANAGLTELGVQEKSTTPAVAENGELPAQVSAGDESANLAGGRTWDNAGPNAGAEDLEESFEMVPRDPAETETPHVPAAVQQTTSWADDVAAEVATKEAEAAPAAEKDDGFHEVQSRRGTHRGHRGDGEGRGRGRGRGGHRGDRGGDRRGGGGYRGDRERRGGGEGRGRGRGQPRGS